MPRKLPWKTSKDDSNVKTSPKIKAEIPRASVPRSPNVAKSPALKKSRRERVVEPERIRSPSTSPPPEPPAEQFMVPGLLDDDAYRMVEDEFLNIAHQFTVHLHRAEYERLKNLAKSQNASTIREIERPTVGPQTLLARKRQESAKRLLKQRELNGTAVDEKDSPWKGTSLRGLLESPRKESKWISSNISSTTKTRASAGFGSNLSSPPRARRVPNPRGTTLVPSSGQKRSRVEVDEETQSSDDDDDDDLATPARVRMSAPKLPRTTPTSATTTTRKTWTPNAPRTAVSSPTTSSRPAKSVYRPTSALNKPTALRLPGDNDDNDDDDPFGISRRRLQRQQSREQARKTEERKSQKKRVLDTIPSFF